jgi:hypothetical protein
VYIDDVRGLLELVRLGVLELHVWGSTARIPTGRARGVRPRSGRRRGMDAGGRSRTGNPRRACTPRAAQFRPPDRRQGRARGAAIRPPAPTGRR